MAACAGLDPLTFARCEDEVEMQYLRTIGARMIEIDKERIEAQAKLTIHELAKALDKGSKKSKGSNTNSTA